MKKIFLFILLIQAGFALNAANPTYTISYNKGGNNTKIVKMGDQVVITAKFSEKMDVAFMPRIRLTAQTGDVIGFSPFKMTYVDSTTFTYNWTVSVGNGKLLPNITVARNLSNELITNTGSTQTTILVDTLRAP